MAWCLLGAGWIAQAQPADAGATAASTARIATAQAAPRATASATRAAVHPSAPTGMSPPQVGADPGPSWSALTPQQRAALAPLQKEWPSIEARPRSKWLELARRMTAMSAPERERIQARMAEWARLTPSQRLQARLNFLDAQQLSPSERQARWEAYQALPSEQREALEARGQQAKQAAASAARTPARGAASGVALRPPVASASAASAARTRQLVSVEPTAPAVLRSPQGATTLPLNAAPKPPAHQAGPGRPPLVRDPQAVDPKTLLPRRGPQAPPALASAALPPATQTVSSMAGVAPPVPSPSPAAVSASAPRP
jgi:hypothetical protein